MDRETDIERGLVDNSDSEPVVCCVDFGMFSLDTLPDPRIPQEERCTPFCPCKCIYGCGKLTCLSCFDIWSVLCCRCLLRPAKLPSWNRRFEVITSLVRNFTYTLGRIKSLRGARMVADNGIPPWSPLLASGVKSFSGKSLDGSSLPAFEFIFPTEQGLPSFMRSTSPESAVSSKRKYLLYFHGGAMVMQNRASHRILLFEVAKATGCTVLSIEYRRAPEFPFPVPGFDCYNSYRWLLDKLEGDSSQIFVGGDSAGGALAIEVLIRIRETKLPMPRGGILLSPWVDLFDTTSSSLKENEKFDIIPYFMLPFVGNAYFDNSTGKSVSAIDQNLENFPPLLIEVGEKEILRDQILSFVKKLSSSGVDVECNIYPDMVHVFQFFAITGMEQPRTSFSRMNDFFNRFDVNSELAKLTTKTNSISLIPKDDTVLNPILSSLSSSRPDAKQEMVIQEEKIINKENCEEFGLKPENIEEKDSDEVVFELENPSMCSSTEELIAVAENLIDLATDVVEMSPKPLESALVDAVTAAIDALDHCRSNDEFNDDNVEFIIREIISEVVEKSLLSSQEVFLTSNENENEENFVEDNFDENEIVKEIIENTVKQIETIESQDSQDYHNEE